ncbi:ATP-binding protein [Pseudochrobactrum sp. XF203]|uniref:ATP-binding protein n=1 Tax=Pseudochrobactrum sp. XF203 TaxID=2879116 RepID=UPI001CE29E9A|nr:ATP-binding protein [Pseudochrobactrum sp. XF203]UCA47000.1 ATP-binding protein [Pseudochrobactrum sp. XF203]
MAKFSIRARTIDLLGRQQIASISTAISELFKNAHDAYADNAEVDYFRDDGLFILRDDGLGMTREAFEERWLTIGTDSKVGSKAGLSSPPADPNKSARPLLGEKGIGRLAIAVIGRQVLVLTRAKVDGQSQPYITAAYIHWGLFELPGIDLDELTIPVEVFDIGKIPNGHDVKAMVSQAKNSLEELARMINVEALQDIINTAIKSDQTIEPETLLYEAKRTELGSYQTNNTISFKSIQALINQAKLVQKNIDPNALQVILNYSKPLESRISADNLNSILQEMDNFTVDPENIYTYLSGSTFKDDETGTHFFILPADSIIQDDIDTREESDVPTRFERNLIGFTNTMTPNISPPNIAVKFRDYIDEGAPIERLGDQIFFTPEEFLSVDHQFHGHFDEYGQFQGTISIYQKKPVDYVLNGPNTNGRKTLCGPFSVSIAVIQPDTKHTRVDHAIHASIKTKMNRHGGLYIYKDGIRVQPYGGSDYDFLAIERRRTKKASTHYYSFRNMMGAITLNQFDNNRLVEKAGREGFREDKAYRQFRSILINFFTNTATDFFNEGGKYSEEWSEVKNELTRLDAVRKKYQKQSKGKKDSFEKHLDTFFDRCDNDEFNSEVKALHSNFVDILNREATSDRTVEQKSHTVSLIEANFKSELKQIRNKAQIKKPSGVGLSKEQLNKWLSYQNQFAQLKTHLFQDVEDQFEKMITSYAHSGVINLSVSERLDSTIKGLGERASQSIHTLKKQTEETLTQLNSSVREKTKKSFRTMSSTVEEIMGELQRLGNDLPAEFDYTSQRNNFEERVNDTYQSEEDQLNALYQQLESVLSFTYQQSVNLVDVTEALEEENIALRERQDVDLELTQIGMALNTINHEFGKTAASLRDGIRRLSSWANANPNLEQVYNDLRVSFEHLDNYLNLFTPLDRRLERKKVLFYGSEIYQYLTDVFQQTIQNKNIKLHASDDFKNKEFVGYRSDYYPVFINLVDNALYWATQSNNNERQVELILDDGDICIRDTGPGVSHKDIYNIFEMNFSRKPGGRGLGLHITKQILHRLGHDLMVDEPKINNGATFRITLGMNKKKQNGIF